jgi:hypothetical protein
MKMKMSKPQCQHQRNENGVAKMAKNENISVSMA